MLMFHLISLEDARTQSLYPSVEEGIEEKSLAIVLIVK